MKQPPAVRNHAFDALRTYAAALVVLVHSAANYVLTRTFDADFVFANVVDSFARIAVPLFVMLSGAFLLGGREESPMEFYRRRSARILVPLLFWTVVCMVIIAVRGYMRSGEVDFGRIATGLVTGQLYYHTWYLYMLVGLYALAPLLNIVVRQLPRRAVWAFAWVALAAGFLNDGYDFIRSAEPGTFLFSWVNYLGYFLLGYLIRTSQRRYPTALLLSCWVLSGAATALLSHYTFTTFRSLYFYQFLSPFVVLGALCVYKIFCQREDSKPSPASRLAPYSFGVYLTHPFLLMALSSAGWEPEEAVPGIALRFAVGFGGGLLLTWLISKVPYLRRIV